MKLIEKSTGKEVTAVYGTTPSGNKRYYIDGKPISDRTLNKKYERAGEDISHRTKVHLKNLFKEILDQDGMSIMKIPLLTTMSIMEQIAVRCSQLNDPILNGLMCRLALYAIADPTDKENYNPKKVHEIIDIMRSEQNKLTQ